MGQEASSCRKLQGTKTGVVSVLQGKQKLGHQLISRVSLASRDWGKGQTALVCLGVYMV
jgi:hypothetical protein